MRNENGIYGGGVMKKRNTFIIGFFMALLICFTGSIYCKAGTMLYSGDDGDVAWSIENENYYFVLKVKPSAGSDGRMRDYDTPLSCCPGSVHPGWVNRTVAKVELQEGIVYIGENAFYSDATRMFICQDLLIIPNTVTGIGSGAFSGNSYIYKVEIPDSVVSIGRGAFAQSTVIICNSGSYAEKYAKENGHRYILKDARIKLNKAKVTTTKGKKISINVLDEKTNEIFGGEYNTSFSNLDVAKRDNNGNIEIIGYGKCVVTYKAGECNATCTITSVPAKPKLKAVKSSKKKTVKITWDKSNADNMPGFQILISQNKNFKKGVKRVIFYNNQYYSSKLGKYVYNNSKTVTGLRSKKTIT